MVFFLEWSVYVITYKCMVCFYDLLSIVVQEVFCSDCLNKHVIMVTCQTQWISLSKTYKPRVRNTVTLFY